MVMGLKMALDLMVALLSVLWLWIGIYGNV
jgi:spore maturation protein SpmA